MRCILCNKDMMLDIKACRQKCSNCGYEIDCEDGGLIKTEKTN